jgi:hypothetical protein
MKPLMTGIFSDCNGNDTVSERMETTALTFLAAGIVSTTVCAAFFKFKIDAA